MDDDVTPEDLARLMGLATRRVLELEAEVERLRGAMRACVGPARRNAEDIREILERALDVAGHGAAGRMP